MKDKILHFVLITLLVGLVLYLPISSIMELTNKNNIQEITITGACEAVSLEHSINYLIPVGTDYYYFGIDEKGDAYVIQAGKKWLEKNFNTDYTAKDSNGIKITGRVKKIHDFQVSNSINESINKMGFEENGINMPLTSECVLDTLYIKSAIVKLVDFFIFVLAALGCLVMVKKKDKCPRVISKATLCLILAFCIISIKLLMQH